MSLAPAQWHQRYAEQARWTRELRRYLLRQAVARLQQKPSAPAGLRLLEVGCGTGAVLADLALPAPDAGFTPTHLHRSAAPLRPYPEGEEISSPPDTPSNLPHLAAQNGGDQSLPQIQKFGGGGRGQETYSSPGARGGRGEGIFGIDLAFPSLSLARQHAPHVQLACADAHHLPFAHASFDLILAHFLLLWVADPARVVREMRRLTRPGGAVLALAEPDYGGRVDFPPALAQVGDWQMASLRSQGADPCAGRKLAGWLAAAGLQEVQAGVLGGQWQTQTFDQEAFASEWGVIASDLDALPGSTALHQQAARLRQVDAQARQHGERILYVPTFYAWGVAS